MNSNNQKIFKVNQKIANKLYKKLKKELRFFDIKQRIILRKTLYARCKQEVYVLNSSIKIRWMDRNDYNQMYCPNSFSYLLYTSVFLDEMIGPVYYDQEIKYKNITRMVYNNRLCRLELHGYLAPYIGYYESKGIFYIYDLIDIRYIINRIKSMNNLELEVLY